MDILAHCLLILTRIIPISIVLVLSLFAYMLLSESELGTFGLVVKFMPYMALGAAIGRDKLIEFFDSRRSSPVFGLALLVVLFTLTAWAHDTAIFNHRPIAFACGVVGSFALIMLVKGCHGYIERVLTVCGSASLVVFLLHPYFQGAARACVLALFGEAAWAQLGLVTLSAVVGPTFVWWLSERYGCTWLFRLNLSGSKDRVSLKQETAQ